MYGYQPPTIFPKREGTKFFCASCKEEIKKSSALVLSTTKSGSLKVHHKICPKDEPEMPDIIITKEPKSFWKFWK